MKILRLLFLLFVVGCLWVAKAIPPKPDTTNGAAGTMDDARVLALSVHDFYTQTRIDKNLEWKMPINFWGRVLDESNQPVAGADIQFVWNILWNPAYPNGVDEVHVKSDENGLFSLVGRRGKGLSVDVLKEGYYGTSSARQSFEYAQPEIRFVPDQASPVVFHLRKKGNAESLIVMRGMMNVPGVGKQFKIPTNGNPVQINLRQGKVVPAGGQIVVFYTANRENSRQYDWHYEIRVPGGGIILSTNEFDFMAPLDGYQPSAKFEFFRGGKRLEKHFRAKIYNAL